MIIIRLPIPHAQPAHKVLDILALTADVYSTRISDRVIVAATSGMRLRDALNVARHFGLPWVAVHDTVAKVTRTLNPWPDAWGPTHVAALH